MSAPRNTGRPRGSLDLHGRATRVSLADARSSMRASVSRAIRHARITGAIAVSELAAACGVTRGQAHAWERGETDLSLGRLRQIASALGVPLAHLVG